MRVHVTFHEKHFAIFDVNRTAAEELSDVQITNYVLQMDLSDTNLFTGPIGNEFREQEQVPRVVPLEAAIKESFADLASTNSESPIVRELRAFADERLCALLDRIKSPVEHPFVDKVALASPANQDRTKRAFIETIKRIDRELPHFFDTEKGIGTFRWLKNGGYDPKLGFSLARPVAIPPIPSTEGRVFMLDQSSETVLFEASQHVAYVLTGEPPSAANALSALCNSGSLGGEVAELNRGAMLRITFDELVRDSNNTANRYAEIADLFRKEPHSKLITAIFAALPGITAVTTIGSIIAQAASRGHLGQNHLVMTAIATALTFLTCKITSNALDRRDVIVQVRKLGAGTNPPRPLDTADTVSTFITALVDHSVSRSAGNVEVVLAPRGQRQWESLVHPNRDIDNTLVESSTQEFSGGRVRTLDLESVPMARIEIMAEDSELTDHEGRQLIQAVRVAAGRMHCIERGSETWNMLHASALLQEFSSRRGMLGKKAPRYSLKAILSSATDAWTDSSGTYPQASKPFKDLTKYFSLDRATWSHVARPLHAACLLERLHESRRAQEIAREVFQKHFAKHA